ncbi:uncharacterized protein ISCGN_021233 [Ixodes scapularis]
MHCPSKKWMLHVRHQHRQPFERRHQATDDLPRRQRRSTPADDMFLKVFLLLCIAVVLAECKPPSQRRPETSDPLPPGGAVVQQPRWRRLQRQRGGEGRAAPADTMHDEDEGEEDIDSAGDDEDDDDDDDDSAGDDDNDEGDKQDKAWLGSHERVRRTGQGHDGQVGLKLDCVFDKGNTCVEWCRLGEGDDRQRRNMDGHQCRYWKTDERNKWMQTGTCRNGRCS